MRGSLDHPPIVVSSDGFKTFGMALLAIGLLLFFVPATISGILKSAAVGWTLIVMFASSVPLFAYMTAKPNLLTIGPDGITFRSLWRVRHFEWWQFEEFFVASFGGYTRKVYFRYRKEADGDPKLGGFGGLWDIGPVALGSLLNLAMERWDKKSTVLARCPGTGGHSDH